MIRHQFGTEEQDFRLRVGEWRDVEKACDAGLGEIAARIAPLASLVEAGVAAQAGGLLSAISRGALGRARLDDVRAPILYGLIGGGRTSTEAGALVKKVFDEAIAAGEGPLLVFAPLALGIVLQAITGLPDEMEPEPPGEAEAAGT
jgi:hypothetical protein